MTKKSYRDQAVCLVEAERERQITRKGYTPEKDRGQWKVLARASAAYLLNRVGILYKDEIHKIWPWRVEFWKPSPGHSTEAAIHDLKRSGALILAALEDLLAQQDEENGRTYLYIGSVSRAHGWANERGIPTSRVIVFNGSNSGRDRARGLKERVTLVDGGEATLSYRDVEAIFRLKAQLQGDDWHEVRARVS